MLIELLSYEVSIAPRLEPFTIYTQRMEILKFPDNSQIRWVKYGPNSLEPLQWLRT